MHIDYEQSWESWVKEQGDKNPPGKPGEKPKQTFDGEYYIEYVEADIVHLRRCR